MAGDYAGAGAARAACVGSGAEFRGLQRGAGRGTGAGWSGGGGGGVGYDVSAERGVVFRGHSVSLPVATADEGFGYAAPGVVSDRRRICIRARKFAGKICAAAHGNL